MLVKHMEEINMKPIVTIKMANGDIMKAELYKDEAPNTVRNFVSLINKGFYDGLTFHRVIPGFMIQGGCPDGNGTGGPGYSIKGEFNGNGFKNEIKHTEGVLSMARAMNNDSAGSQFFLMTSDAGHLDGQYAAKKIVAVKADRNDKPLKPVVIEKVTVDTFGEEIGEPETL
jgi:peptidyl-prolyl cis-trans isomerase B (cyclophilin B)